MKENLKLVTMMISAIIGFALLVTMIYYIMDKVENRTQSKAVWCNNQIEICRQLCGKRNFGKAKLNFFPTEIRCTCEEPVSPISRL
jgi:hypothetical protein